MKNIIKFLYITFASLLISSCENYTEGLNDNPNAFTQVAPELVIGQVQLAYMKLMESNTARYANIFANQMHGCDRQYLTLNTYSENRANYNDMWNDAYISGIAQAKLIIDNEKSSNTLKGVAQILQGSLYAELALLYGDIPFTQAVNPDEYPNPTFDSQQSVIEGGIALIKAGIANVGTSTTVSAAFGGNRIAGGTWAEAGNTLVARYELSLGNYAAAITAATDGIASRANDLVVQHGTSLDNRNLYYQFTIDARQQYLCAANNGSAGQQSHLYNLLKSSTVSGSAVTRTLATSGDSYRLSHYFIDSDEIVELNSNTGARFAQTASFPLASYYENQLILAEANYKKSSKDEAAARTNLNNVRTELVAEYNALGFKDASGNGITITQNDFPTTSATGDVLLRQILEEKYITLIGEVVTFHDLRRTGNFLNVPLKAGASLSTFPQRFLYPQGEVDNNSSIPTPTPGFVDKTTVLGKTY